MNYVNVCAILHNFLLVEKDEVTEIFYEDYGCVSDVDAGNELNRLVGAAQSNDTRRRKLNQCFPGQKL